MALHHDKHHQAYVATSTGDRAISAAGRTRPRICCALDGAGGHRTAVRNNGGGHLNHQFFWDILGPRASGAPKGAIADAIKRDFGSFEQFQSLFTDAATKQFGSGWAWLVRKGDGSLDVVATRDAANTMTEHLKPILTCDIWEHAAT
jgi:Fe-Mn family superoxide dismutase